VSPFRASKRPTFVTIAEAHARLDAVDVSACRVDGGPIGPGVARVRLVAGGVRSAELVSDPQGYASPYRVAETGFATSFAGTTTGRCVLDKLLATRTGKLEVETDYDVPFLVPPAQGAAFDRSAVAAALRSVDVSACRVESGQVRLRFEPEGNVRVFFAAARPIQGVYTPEATVESAQSRCVDAAFRRLGVRFTGSPVYAKWDLGQ
jgi:hypothetical protein